MPGTTIVGLCLTFAAGSLGLATHARADDSAASTPATLMVVGARDTQAAYTATTLHSHIMPQLTATPAAGATAQPIARAPKHVNSVSGWFPADLAYGGGAVVPSTMLNDIYVNCTNSCWGTPQTFESHLVSSKFLHLTDQYTAATTNGRYTVGPSGNLTYNFFGNTLYYSDILAIVHASAVQFGSGYGHIFNIFLPSGTNICDQNGACYKGTTPAQFCAYHASTDFSDVGHVLYSVEPYQAVPGCSVGANSPNGELVDSTSSTLLHETIETITDPDNGTGWYAQDAAVNGEIADLCSGRFFTTAFGTKSYATQYMYSNNYHACVNGP
jgi:hypothetical protein